MEITINGKPAALKEGTSFELVSENRMFTGSDSYTLNISFPLRGCPQNLEIFGYINREDVTPTDIVFECEIRDRSLYKYGSIVITEISEVEVKTQFLEGRSAQNFESPLDSLVINHLDLGAPPTTAFVDITPAQAWDPAYNNSKCVALPWVNDHSGNLQNKAEYSSGIYSWNTADSSGLSWQPYLLYLTKQICAAIGYTCDFSEWEAREEYKYILVCNALPCAWDLPGFAHALPAWTVEEYFEKLELFMGAEFEFDHRRKHVAMAFTADILTGKQPVTIVDVIEEHSTEVSMDGDGGTDYAEARNLVYAECDHSQWKYYSCDWFIRDWKYQVFRFDTLAELMPYQGLTYRVKSGEKLPPWGKCLYYVKEIDTYFIPYHSGHKVGVANPGAVGESVEWLHQFQVTLRRVNYFGGRIVDDSEEAETDEIEFVPVNVADTDDRYGPAAFLSPGSYDEYEPLDSEVAPFGDRDTLAMDILKRGESDKKTEYYSLIYVAWYDGVNYNQGTRLPHPEVYDISFKPGLAGYNRYHFSLRLSDRSGARGVVTHAIDPRLRVTFKFLSNTIPDVRSEFRIRGKRYVCKKITATFTENGMSQLLKGEFYPIKDN